MGLGRQFEGPNLVGIVWMSCVVYDVISHLHFHLINYDESQFVLWSRLSIAHIWVYRYIFSIDTQELVLICRGLGSVLDRRHLSRGCIYGSSYVGVEK